MVQRYLCPAIPASASSDNKRKDRNKISETENMMTCRTSAAGAENTFAVNDTEGKEVCKASCTRPAYHRKQINDHVSPPFTENMHLIKSEVDKMNEITMYIVYNESRSLSEGDNMNSFTQKLTDLSEKLAKQRYVSAIKDSFMNMMPLIICGSFAILFQNVICSTTPGFVSLANIPGMAWLSVLSPMFATINYACMNFMAIGIVMMIAVHIGESYGNTDKAIGLNAIACFVTLCSTKLETTVTAPDGTEFLTTINNVLSSKYTSATGLFVAIFVGIASAKMYLYFAGKQSFTIRLPESVPKIVSKSFAVLLPVVFSVFLTSAIGMIFLLTVNMTMFDAITAFIQAPLTKALTGLPGYLLIYIIANLLWCLGINGTSVLSAVTTPVLLSALLANTEAHTAGAAMPNVINASFASAYTYITGSGMTGGLVIAIFLFSKRDDFRSIAKLEVPCAIFNINEPIVFGLPIVMNPLMAIPFVLAPVASSITAYFLTSVGFAGTMYIQAPWTTPIFLQGFLSAGGNIGAGVTQLICLAVSTAVYTPFVLMSNGMKPATKEEADA